MRFPAAGGLVGENANGKKVAQFRGETLGADGFFPRILRFPAPGGTFGHNTKGKKMRTFWKNLLGRTDFFPKAKSTPRSGKLRTTIPDSVVTFCLRFRDPWRREIVFFCFWPSPGTCPSAHSPKQATTPLNHRFRLVGVQPEKNLFPRKLRQTIPDSLVIFFIWGPPLLLGPERALGCYPGCLLARRASSTLVP